MSSVVAYGTATNPSAGGQVAATASLTGPAKYVVTVTTNATGTIAAGDLNNVQLQVGATVVGRMLMNPTANTYLTNPPVTVDVPLAGAAISVNATGNASGVSAVYGAQIVATVG